MAIQLKAMKCSIVIKPNKQAVNLTLTNSTVDHPPFSSLSVISMKNDCVKCFHILTIVSSFCRLNGTTCKPVSYDGVRVKMLYIFDSPAEDQM